MYRFIEECEVNIWHLFKGKGNDGEMQNKRVINIDFSHYNFTYVFMFFFAS